MDCVDRFVERRPATLEALLAAEEFAGDSAEECGEAAARGVERRWVLEEPDEDLLGELVGLCGVSGHVESKVEDGARVAFVEDGEGFVTAYGEGGEERLILVEMASLMRDPYRVSERRPGF